MKKIITILIVILLISSNLIGANAATSDILMDEENGYTYKVLSDGTLEITEYSGTATEITLPEEFNGYKVTSVGGFAFSKNNTIENLIIPASIEAIGFRAFEHLECLKTVEIFGDKSWIENNEINPYNGNRAFSGCANLTSVILHDGISILGNKSFYWCESLKEIHIPVTVGEIKNESIGYNKFTSGNTPNVSKDITFKIYGYENSIAEVYANKNDMVFVSTGNLIEDYMLDVNYDNNINAEDALLVLKHAAKISELDYNQNMISDANDDDTNNASDALEILKQAAGL